MSYYDPWVHAIQIFVSRVLQFFLLSLAVGAASWFGVLHAFFNEVDLWPLTWRAITGENHTARVILNLCLALGATQAAWLFGCLILCGSNSRPERHHRGARIVQHGDE